MIATVMTECARSTAIQSFSEIELFLSSGDYEKARVVLAQRLNQNPLDRQSKLCLLLVNVIIDGPTAYEDAIDQLRSLSSFNDIEKNIVQRIFVLGVYSAEKRGHETQAWVYQRLLRRLLLDKPLDLSIPKSAVHARPISEKHLCRLRRRLRMRQIPLSLKNVCWSCFSWYRCAWHTERNLNGFTPKLFQQVVVIAASLSVLIISSLYVLFLDDSMIKKKANSMTVVLPAFQNVAQTLEIVTLRKPTETLPHDSPLPGLGTSSSAVAKSQRQSVELNEYIPEVKTSAKSVTTAPDSTNSDEPLGETVGYKTLRSTAIRQEPRFGSHAIEDVGPGTVISVLEANGDWVKVKTQSSGSVGYVRREYLASITEP